MVNLVNGSKPSKPGKPVYLQRFSDNMIDFKLIYKGKPSKLVNINYYQTKFKKETRVLK